MPKQTMMSLGGLHCPQIPPKQGGPETHIKGLRPASYISNREHKTDSETEPNDVKATMNMMNIRNLQ